MKVICISGKAESGKTTFSEILKRQLEQYHKRVLIIHYGDYLKFVAEKYFQWNGKKDEQGRQILQILGTEKARNNNPDIWVNVAAELIFALKPDYDFVLIPDSRFENEVEVMKQRGLNTISIRIERPAHKSKLTDEQKNHRSETSLDDFNFDYCLFNAGGLDQFNETVKAFISNERIGWIND